MQNIWERIFRSANFIVPGMILYVNQFYHKEELDFLQFWCNFFIVWTPNVHPLTVYLYLCAPLPCPGENWLSGPHRCFICSYG